METDSSGLKSGNLLYVLPNPKLNPKFLIELSDIQPKKKKKHQFIKQKLSKRQNGGECEQLSINSL